jgi:heme/copper-type cytochrome/quinol oxidase subunit 2
MKQKRKINLIIVESVVWIVYSLFFVYVWKFGPKNKKKKSEYEKLATYI